MPKGWKLGRSGVRLHNFTFFSISALDLMMKSFSLCLPVNTFVIVSKIGTPWVQVANATLKSNTNYSNSSTLSLILSTASAILSMSSFVPIKILW